MVFRLDDACVAGHGRDRRPELRGAAQNKTAVEEEQEEEADDEEEEAAGVEEGAEGADGEAESKAGASAAAAAVCACSEHVRNKGNPTGDGV